MSRPFELQGHRGARGLFPENTLEGFCGALAVGVTSVELDVAMTADDVLVVTHDPVLNPDLTRGPGGAWLPAAGPAVRALRLAELETYDVGEARPGGAAARAHPLQRAFATARIPTLEAALEALAPSGVVVDVELKTDPLHPERSPPPAEMADAVVALAGRLGALDRLGVRSFDWRGLFHLRDRWPRRPARLADGARDREPDMAGRVRPIRPFGPGVGGVRPGRPALHGRRISASSTRTASPRPARWGFASSPGRSTTWATWPG